MDFVDIKPNNILLKYDGKAPSGIAVKLCDFGMATLMDPNKSTAGQEIGAPIFRSPEAFIGQPWGTPTDIWSFGAVVSIHYLTDTCKCPLTICIDCRSDDRTALAYLQT